MAIVWGGFVKWAFVMPGIMTCFVVIKRSTGIGIVVVVAMVRGVITDGDGVVVVGIDGGIVVAARALENMITKNSNIIGFL